ncbi:MAG: PA14 domain-containing protein, partial [Planctomycetota bacterium]
MCRKLMYLASFVMLLSMVGSARGQLGQGNILYEYWDGISGTAVSGLTGDPRYPDSPDESLWWQTFEGQVGRGDNYGIRARGYVSPPVSGDYIFWISGDDECQLWLSTDEDPANIDQVSHVTGWTNSREWTKYPEQKSKPISLQAGQRYYIEALMKEGGGGDSLAVGWGGPGIGEGPVIIEGKYLSPVLTSYAKVMQTAREPNPADGSIHSDTWVTVTWTAGFTAASHDVYFSDNLADVQARTAEAFRGNQTLANFVVGFPGFPYPDGLVSGTTYYWVIDEIEADGTTLHEGNIWSFLVPPKSAYYPEPVDGADSVDPNETLTWQPGFGAILHYVYFGDDYDTVSNAAGAMPWGAPTYSPGTLELGKAFYWRVDAFHGAETFKGEVWSFSTPGAVGSPIPSNAAVDVTQTQILTWVASDNATSHEVYFGMDKGAVRSADTGSPEYKGSETIGSESHDPGKLEWDSTYYWRVDEVEAGGTQKGIVWSFTTANFLIVDDFESYNDLDPADPASNRIFNVWLDGYNDPTNGALVGNDMPPFAEQTFVHGGLQSMPLFYDNSAGKSEATLTLTYPRDWTEKDVDTLTIWFRGASANTPETLYVALNGSTVVDHDNPDAAKITSWTEWNVSLTRFSDQGVDLA